MMMTSCAGEYDDAALKSSISKLEQQAAALQSALNAVEKNLHILSVKETDDAFYMTFSDGSTVTVQKPDDTGSVEPTAEYISEIAVENGVVVFHLSDGRSFSIPVKTAFTFSLDVDSTVPIKSGQTITVGWKAETSMGGMYAQQMFGFRKICVNPAFNMSHASKVLRTGTHKFFNRRKDNQKEFTVTKELIQHYNMMERQQFKGITDFDRENTYGLFGIHDTQVNTYDLFRKYYSNARRFDGEHRLNEAVLTKVVVPLVREILSL